MFCAKYDLALCHIALMSNVLLRDLPGHRKTVRFLVRELYACRVFKMIFTTRVNSYIGTTIVVPD